MLVKKPPLFRFTIGPCSKLGLKCLDLAVTQIQKVYGEAEIVVCYNCDESMVSHLPIKLVNQLSFTSMGPQPMGVAWKLYPPRLDISRHEIVIDNDLLLFERIEEIDEFLEGNHTLLLEEESRTYGKFNKHVPANLKINSGLFGLPPGFDFEKYVKANAGKEWTENAKGEYAASKTFDEQGLVALILSNQKYRLIPKTSITNCERRWVKGKGNHFIGVNRTERHRAFNEYLSRQTKLL